MYGAAQWHEGVHCTFEKGAKIAGKRLLFERGEVSIRASRLLMHAEFEDLSSPCILSNFGSSKGTIYFDRKSKISKILKRIDTF